MARPKVRAQHFLACRGVEVEGLVGPDNPYTLHGVRYRIGVSPDTEYPTDLFDLWTFCRFVNVSDHTGRIEFSIEVVWLDGRRGEEPSCYYPDLAAYFRAGLPVVSCAWRFRRGAATGAGPLRAATPVREEKPAGGGRVLPGGGGDMSKKRGRKRPPPPGGESCEMSDAGFPQLPEGSPPPKTILGPGPDGTYVVIWRATEAEPTPPPSLWPPMPPGPTR